jgi:hypothetical protein
VFALDLMSAYEGEHMIFGLLGQANLNFEHPYPEVNFIRFYVKHLA